MGDEGGDEPVPVEEPVEEEPAPAAEEPAGEAEVAADGGEEAAPAEEGEAEAAPADADAEAAPDEAPPDDVPVEEAEEPMAEEAAPEAEAEAEAPAEEEAEPAAEEVAAEPAAEDAVEEEPADPAPEETEEPRFESEALGAESGRSEGAGSPDLLLGEDSMPEGGVDSAMLSGDLSPGGGDLSPSGDMPYSEGGDQDGDEFGEDDYEDDKVDPLQELQEKYDQLLELNERAMQTNVALQRRVIQRKAQDKSYDASEKQSDGKVTEHKYQNVLLNVHSVRLKLRLQQVKAARMSEELKNQLEAKRQKAIECRDSFQEFKRQVARHAEYARTGKKIPEKIIQEVEEFELDKDAEVEEVRGSNISLKNRLAKLEQALRKKDELAENLHVIDFEQLKIENQTLNEKIEERNEELHKLRKKTIVTVQIITHMREKVQFVQQEYWGLKSELAQLELDLAAQRDTVTKTKHEREEIRSDNAKYRQQTGITNSEGLSKDYEDRATHIKQLIEAIAQLKNRHKQMMQFVKRHGGKV